jgi:hypothetical protein
MITKEKVKEYTSFDGDIDGYARTGRGKKNIINDEEWSFIDKMVSEIGLIRKVPVTDSFVQQHKNKRNEFESPEVYQILVDYETKS